MWNEVVDEKCLLARAPRHMMLSDLGKLTEANYMCTAKADGILSILCIDARRDDMLAFVRNAAADAARFSMPKAVCAALRGYVLYAEYVRQWCCRDDAADVSRHNNDRPAFMIFDVQTAPGQRATTLGQPLRDRLAVMQHISNMLRSVGRTRPALCVKPYYTLRARQTLLKRIVATPNGLVYTQALCNGMLRCTPCDGVIFSSTRDTELQSLKLKRACDTTFDFFVSIRGYSVRLYAGGANFQRVLIREQRLCPAWLPYAGVACPVECTLDTNTGSFVPVRKRPDREACNSTRTVFDNVFCTLSGLVM